jgi:hypothetical protein
MLELCKNVQYASTADSVRKRKKYPYFQKKVLKLTENCPVIMPYGTFYK